MKYSAAILHFEPHHKLPSYIIQLFQSWSGFSLLISNNFATLAEAQKQGLDSHYFPNLLSRPRGRFFWLILTPIQQFVLLYHLFKWRWLYGVKTILCLSINDQFIISGLARLLRFRVIWQKDSLGTDLSWGKDLLLNRHTKHVTIVTSSAWHAQQLNAQGVPVDRLTTIYPGLPPTTRNLQDSLFHMMARKKEMTHQVFSVACLLNNSQDLEIIFTALTQLPPDLQKRVNLLIFAHVELKSYVDEHLQKTLFKTITWMKYSSLNKRWLWEFDLLLYPNTEFNSLPWLLILALVKATPVLTSMHPLLQELMPANTLVKDTTGQSWSMAIGQALKHPKQLQQLADENQKLVSKKFDWPSCIQAWQKLLKTN